MTWLLLLCGFCVYIAYLLISGDIVRFLHPKSVKFTSAMLVVLSILAIFQARKIKKTHGQPFRAGYLIFALPLFLGITVSPSGLSEDIATIRGISMNAAETTEGFSLFSPNRSRQIDFSSTDLLVIDDIHYDEALKEIYYDLNRYEGQHVSIKGFIFRHDHFEPGTAFISRLLITCCAADAIIVGIIAEHKELALFDNNSWVHLEGTIDRIIYYDVWLDESYEVPVIIPHMIEAIEKPLIPYVYPYDYSGPQH